MEEDRISDLPDCIIHHILSFLPSTKEAIQTSILSKRWLNQWTHVPVLIFNDSTGISHENFLNFVDNTLTRHDCSKIKIFKLEYHWRFKIKDPKFESKILFAIQKNVEKLYLSPQSEELLPQFVFNNASNSLVKFRISNSTLIPDKNFNWGCLTSLKLNSCELTHQVLEQILSGSPLLESLELSNCSKLYNKLVINASKCLKKLVIYEYQYFLSAINISYCPNLVKISLHGVGSYDALLFAPFIENVLSTSPLLEYFELDNINIPLHNLVIASKSLKRLVLGLNDNNFNLHVSCPQLELFELSGNFNLTTAKLLDLPSSLCASFDFEEPYGNNKTSICTTNLVKDILQQLRHVKQLTIGSLFINILSSTLGVGYPLPFVLNVKILTLNTTNLNKHYSGIARLLRHAPELEKLVIVIDEPIYDETDLETLDDFAENFWNRSDAVVFNCLVSNLKTIKINGFPKRHDELKCLISFVRFLLNNARVLEKMVLVTTFPFGICDELLQLPRCSNAIVEFQYSRE